MAFSEILPFFGVNADERFIVAPVGGFNLVYHSLGPLRDIQADGSVVAKDVTDAVRKAPDLTQTSKAPNPLFVDKDDMKAFAQAVSLGLQSDKSRRLLAVYPRQIGSYSVKLFGARETDTITVLASNPKPATISFRYLKYTGPWPPEGAGKDDDRYSKGVKRTKAEGSQYAKLVDQILRHQAMVTVTLQSSEDVGFDKGFGPVVSSNFFKEKLRSNHDQAANVTIFVVPRIDGAEGREFPDDTSSVMVAEQPMLALTGKNSVDNFALVAAHELAHALGASHKDKEGLLMSDYNHKQNLLVDRKTLFEINSPAQPSKK
jgi:Matrixin